MCRYGFKTYKPHFVCFKCRKTFKQPLPFDLLERDNKARRYTQLQSKDSLIIEEQEELNKLNRDYFNREIKCPECGSLMADLGLDFKAPPKTEVKRWKIIEGLYTVGHSFHTCGCTGPGFIPKDKSEYREYLKDYLASYSKQLQDVQRLDVQTSKDKNESINYWAERVRMIETELIKFELTFR